MHRPDADSHCRGPTAQPKKASPIPRGSYSSGKVECCVGGEDRDHSRQRDKKEIVRAGQVHVGMDHDSDLVCPDESDRLILGPTLVVTAAGPFGATDRGWVL